MLQGLDDRCCRIPPPFAPSGHPRGAKKKKEKKEKYRIDPSRLRDETSGFLFFSFVDEHVRLSVKGSSRGRHRLCV